MFSEDDLLPLSGLQHLAFCERQWALIHLEQVWAENMLTAEGRVMHERTHGEETEERGNVRIARGLRIRSLRLGLVGMMDVVEFVCESRETNNFGEKTGVNLHGANGWWRPKPVEYKRGRPKSGHCDEVQLCAQALCLEEMLDVAISSGSIFYGRPRRRTDVAFDVALRREIEALAARLHELYRMGKTPPPKYSKKCPNCSLIEICKPKIMGSRSTSNHYVAKSLREMGMPILPRSGDDK